MQPEGDHNFKGVLKGIEQLVRDTELPVIVKETGAGLSKYTAKRLLNAGVEVLDVAGAGGTSWAKVENYRNSNHDPHHNFDDWGIPTTVCLEEIQSLQWDRSFELIASGGIRSADHMAKALCLGATFTATAQPIIKTVINEGQKGLETLINTWKKDLRIILALLGCTSIKELNKSHLLLK